MLIYRAAGENTELAKAELEGFLRSRGLEPEVERRGRLHFSPQKPIKGQLKRLTLCHEVCELLEEVEEDQIDDWDPDVSPEGSFAVRSNSKELKYLEEQLGSSIEAEVDLERPDVLYRIFKQDGAIYLGKRIIEIDRGLFEKRSNEERPYSSPVSMDPALARVLINLAETPAGEHLLDPFCGTGGVLIEAGLCGIGVHGCDIDPEMVEGTRKNLEEYGVIAHDIRECDFRNADEEFEGEIHSLVSDLPYGRSSKTEGDIEKVVEVAEELEVEKTVVVYNEPEFAGYESDFEIYVHKNLSRYIFIINP